MLVPAAFALVVLYVGYAAYEASVAREAARNAPPPGPDPVLEMERLNTELSRLATQSRQTLENARDATRKGLKG